MQSRLALGGLVAALVLVAGAPLAAQVDVRERRLPLAPNRPAGEALTPFLEGWYANPDGTYTFSFGYFNLNTQETIDIPLGPNNFIEPTEFDGMQPTYFPAPTEGVRPRSPGYNRHERGIFTVTVPAEDRDRRESVVWTLRINEETHTLKASIGPSAFSWTMVLGRWGPCHRFSPSWRMDRRDSIRRGSPWRKRSPPSSGGR